MKKALLLDVDGVVLRNAATSNMVKHRVIEYVRYKTAAPLTKAAAINKRAYTIYGHTLLGLRALYPSMSPTLADFNDYVYTDDLVEAASKTCTYETGAFDEANQIRFLMSYCKGLGVPVYLYSNAPKKWLEMVCDMYDLDMNADNMLASDNEKVFQGDEVLKPQLRSYARVQKHLLDIHGKDIRFLFVDDSIDNVEVPHKKGSRWDCFHLTADKSLVNDVIPWIVNGHSVQFTKSLVLY